jgi:hypothetical protein
MKGGEAMEQWLLELAKGGPLLALLAYCIWRIDSHLSAVESCLRQITESLGRLSRVDRD